VLLAPARGARPGALATSPLARETESRTSCPFCPGHEHETEPTEASVGDPWSCRAFRNRYPAVEPEPSEVPAESTVAQVPGVGLHDVVVPSPAHDRRWSDLDVAEIDALGRVVAERMREHHAAGPSTQLLVNWGRAAGASVDHIHAQVITVPVVPEPIRAEVRALVGACVLCGLADDEDFEVDRAAGWVTSCPPWGATPYELLLVPDAHPSRVTESPETVAAMFTAFGSAVRTLEALLGAVSFNAVLHEAPRGVETYHAHVHLWPSLVNTSGFERGTGIHINVVDPRSAAADLRLGSRR
jgi:UDPglucose--hexose-1-phosphate uridylyltransferase